MVNVAEIWPIVYIDGMAGQVETLEQIEKRLAGEVARRLRQLREEYGLTQEDLAWNGQRLGYRWRQPEISRLENDKDEGVKSLAHIIALARALPCHPAQLLEPLLADKVGQTEIGPLLDKQIGEWHDRHRQTVERLRGLDSPAAQGLLSALGDLSVLDPKTVRVIADLAISRAAALRKETARTTMPVSRRGRSRAPRSALGTGGPRTKT